MAFAIILCRPVPSCGWVDLYRVGVGWIYPPPGIDGGRWGDGGGVGLAEAYPSSTCSLDFGAGEVFVAVVVGVGVLLFGERGPKAHPPASSIS